jgi:hypothetical protein
MVVARLGDLISARLVTAGVRSTQWLGQMSDASLQQLSRDRGGVAMEKDMELRVGWLRTGMGRIACLECIEVPGPSVSSHTERFHGQVGSLGCRSGTRYKWFFFQHPSFFFAIRFFLISSDIFSCYVHSE